MPKKFLSAEEYNEYSRNYYKKNRDHLINKQKERYRKNKDHILSQAKIRYHGRYRDTKLAKIYGISKQEAQYWLSIKECQICGTTNRRLVLDHDHTTNKMRGRLCTNCNSGIDQFKDSPETLELAAKYLRDRSKGEGNDE